MFKLDGGIQGGRLANGSAAGKASQRENRDEMAIGGVVGRFVQHTVVAWPRMTCMFAGLDWTGRRRVDIEIEVREVQSFGICSSHGITPPLHLPRFVATPRTGPLDASLRI